MRCPKLLALLALAACAPAGPNLNTASAPTRPTRIEGIQSSPGGDAGTLELAINSRARPREEPVAGSPEQLWPALVAVYQEMEIPIATLDSVRHLIGNRGAAVRRTLAGAPLSRYLDCGRNAVNSPNADLHPVNLRIFSLLKPMGDGSTQLQTLIEGSAKNPVNNDPAVQCSSTGRLEGRIAEELRKRAGG